MYITTSGYYAYVNHTPDAQEKCIDCKHSFQLHYETYGGVSGCASEERRRCKCPAFAMRYRKSYQWTYYPSPSWWYNTPNWIPAINTTDYNTANDYSSDYWKNSVKHLNAGDSVTLTSAQAASVSLYSINNAAGTAPMTMPQDTTPKEVQFKEGEILRYKRDR